MAKKSYSHLIRICAWVIGAVGAIWFIVMFSSLVLEIIDPRPYSKPQATSSLPVFTPNQIKVVISVLVLFQTCLCFGLLMSFAFMADILEEIRQDTRKILGLLEKEDNDETDLTSNEAAIK